MDCMPLARYEASEQPRWGPGPGATHWAEGTAIPVRVFWAGEVDRATAGERDVWVPLSVVPDLLTGLVRDGIARLSARRRRRHGAAERLDSDTLFTVSAIRFDHLWPWADHPLDELPEPATLAWLAFHKPTPAFAGLWSPGGPGRGGDYEVSPYMARYTLRNDTCVHCSRRSTRPSIGKSWYVDQREESFDTLLDGLAHEPPPEDDGDLSVDEFVARTLAHLDRYPELHKVANEVGELLRLALRAEQVVSALAGDPEHVLYDDDIASLEAEAARSGESVADVWEDLRLEGEVRRRVLRHPMLNSTAVGRLLGSGSINPRTAASERRRSGELLGLKVGNKYVFPLFQFDASNGEIRQVVKTVNKLLGAEDDPWAVAAWWLTPHGRFGGRRPAQLLGTDEEDRIEAVAHGEVAGET